MRLAREALGERRYRRENEALRDAARPLSAIRDAKILVETFDGLLNRASPEDQRALAGMRDFLVTNQQKTRARVLGSKRRLAPVVKALRQAHKRIDGEIAGNGGWSVVGPGFRRVYRNGHDAWLEARKKPTAEGLHEWRKQTKYLWHQIQMLEPSQPQVLKPRAKQAHKLSDHLGADHDLAVLRQKVNRAAAEVGEQQARRLSELIDRRRKKLQSRSMAIGAKVYKDEPKAYVRRTRDYWSAWKAS